MTRTEKRITKQLTKWVSLIAFSVLLVVGASYWRVLNIVIDQTYEFGVGAGVVYAAELSLSSLHSADYRRGSVVAVGPDHWGYKPERAVFLFQVPLHLIVLVGGVATAVLVLVQLFLSRSMHNSSNNA